MKRDECKKQKWEAAIFNSLKQSLVLRLFFRSNYLITSYSHVLVRVLTGGHWALIIQDLSRPEAFHNFHHSSVVIEPKCTPSVRVSQCYLHQQTRPCSVCVHTKRPEASPSGRQPWIWKAPMCSEKLHWGPGQAFSIVPPESCSSEDEVLLSFFFCVYRAGGRFSLRYS